MKRSSDRLLTTHAGSLPRPDDVAQMVKSGRADEDRLRAAVTEVVRKQADIGIDVVDDGEYSKPSFVTYVQERLAGFEPLLVPNYRKYWFGLTLYVISVRAEWLTFAWLAWELTHDPLALGYLGAAQGLPMILFQLYGGVLADRMERKRILIISQLLAAVVITVALVLTVLGAMRLELLLAFPLLRHVPSRNRACLPQPHEAGDVLSPRAYAALLMAPVHQGVQDVLRPPIPAANALGSIEFMTREGEKIDPQVLNVQGEFPKRLHGIRMHENAALSYQVRNLRNGLECPDFVIGIHDGHEDGIVREGVPDGPRSNNTMRIHRNIGDLVALLR